MYEFLIKFILLRISREQSSQEDSDDSDKQEKHEKRRSFKQQSFLKRSQPSAVEQRNVNNLVVNNTKDSDDSDDDVIIGGSRLNLRNDARKSSTPRDEGLCGMS